MLKLRKPEQIFTLLSLSVVIYKLSGIALIFYGVYFTCFMLELYHFAGKTEQIIMKYLIYSLMLPDNYSIIAISFILMLVYFRNGRTYKRNLHEKNIALIIKIFVFVAVLSGALHLVPAVNLMFAFIYGFTFFFYLIYFMDRTKSQVFRDSAEKWFVQVLFIEILATLFNLQYWPQYGDDWNFGTLTPGQQNIIMVMFAAGFLMYFYKRREEKDKTPFAITFLIISLTTFCNTNTIFLFFAGAFAYLQKKQRKNLYTIILILFMGFFTFKTLLPEGV